MMVSRRNIVRRNRIVAMSDYDVILVEFTLPIIDQFYFKKLSGLLRCKGTQREEIA